ncbi:MAG: hypothetical protein ABSA94_15805 [Acidobacteriaceae bacterium]
MAKRSQKKKVSEPTKRFVLGREEIAAIQAVEGLKLSPEGEQRLKETEGLSPEERIAVIIAAYKAKAAQGR